MDGRTQFYYNEFDKELDKYRSTMPYPDSIVVIPNAQYAERLMDVYAGINSELTGIAQYGYHSNFNLDINEKIAKELGGIAQVESIHMSILFQIIIALGGYPSYRGSTNSNNEYWSGKYVCYGRKLKEQLECDLNLEYGMIREYNTLIQLIKDPGVQKVLERILEDEKVHTQFLENLLNQYF